MCFISPNSVVCHRENRTERVCSQLYQDDPSIAPESSYQGQLTVAESRYNLILHSVFSVQGSLNHAFGPVVIYCSFFSLY